MTLTECQQMVDLYLQAERDILLGKTVEFAGRKVSRENLAEIRQGRAEWERRRFLLARRKGFAVGVFQ